MSHLDARLRRHLDHDVEHYLYRVYDATDRLLYIGCAQDVGARQQVHASSWQNPVSAYLNMRAVRWDVEAKPYSGKVAGHAAEKFAIEAEAPLLNRNHNKGRGLRGEALEAELQRTRPAVDPELMASLVDVLANFGDA